MAYCDFTLTRVLADFSLNINESTDLFPNVEPVAPTALLSMILEENIPLLDALNTEKARSELAIAPILLEVRRHFNYQISFFSGIDFNVAPEKGLAGYCDFLLSRSPEQYFIKDPVVAIVEAKNENIKSGLGQCVAEMVAAQMFNQRNSIEEPVIYGIVTTGQIWKFLKLEGQTVFIDKVDFYVNFIDRILGVLVFACQSR